MVTALANINDIDPWAGRRDSLSPFWDLRNDLGLITDIPEPTDLQPGELREVDWPIEDDVGVRDFRLQLADGRRLAIQTAGPQDGYPILFLHGMPSCRVSAVPPYQELERLGCQIITWDRGYGRSDPHPGRDVAAVGDDARQIVDALLSGRRFGIIGRSGGSPHALAINTILDEQVDRTVLLNPPAPREADEILYQGIGDTNGGSLSLHVEAISQSIYAEAAAIKRDPCAQLRKISQELTRLDLEFLSTPRNLARVAMSHWLAIEPGVDGWLEDRLAIWPPSSDPYSTASSWGFNFRDVQGDVQIWCGAKDSFTPQSHAEWLAEKIPSAELTLEHQGSHFLSMDLAAVLMHFFNDKISKRARLYSVGP